MIFQIAKKEIKVAARTASFKWILAIVVLLGCTSVYISHSYFTHKQEQQELATSNERDRWLGQGSINPHNAAHYGTYAFKPLFPLSLVDPGVEKFAGISIYLESHSRNEADFIAAADQTGLSRFGDLTPDFLLLFIVPLIIIVMGHRSITLEKHNNTIRLIKMQGVSGAQLIAGKWLGNFIPIAILSTGIFLLAGIFIVSLERTIDWRFLIAMFVLYLIYYAVINSITVFVSAVSKNSGISLVSLLAIWMISCLVIPKIASSYTNSLYPYPSRHQFETTVAEDKKTGIDGYDPWSEASKKLEEETLRAYQVNSLEELPFNFDAYRMQQGEEHEAAVYYKHYENLKQIYEQQTNIYRTLAIFSPFLPMRFLSMSLAHTDYTTHWNFTDAAEKHRVEMQYVLNTDFAENSSLGEWDYKADASLLSEIPVFEFKAAGFSETLHTNLSNILILLTWLLVSLGFLFLASKRL